MGSNSAIEWTQHTFNPWIGCQTVSPGCDNCYAEGMMDHRLKRVQWGPRGLRKRTNATYWKQPLKWNEAARKAGKRARVFCASLADVFDNHASIDPQWRLDLWELIAETPYLDWQLLTKRPQNIGNMLPIPFDFEKQYPNVWLGTTVENQDEANRRIPHLLSVPAAVRFLSAEPLLEPVNLRSIATNGGWYDSLFGWRNIKEGPSPEKTIDWVIVGGESGKGFRPFNPDWARSIRDQCQEANVAFFMKQMGGARKPFAPIPDDLMIRQFPK